MIRSPSKDGNGYRAEKTKEEATIRTSNDAPNEPRLISEYVGDALRWLQRPLLVRLNKRGILTFREAPGYELHVDDFSTRSGLLYWLWHFLVTGKRWVTLDLLLDLVATIKGHDDRKAAKRRKPPQPASPWSRSTRSRLPDEGSETGGFCADDA